MKKALVIGATGATGQFLVEQLNESDLYDKIYIVHYKSTSFASFKKVEEIIINFDQLGSELRLDHSIDKVFCCIGTTIKKAGSKENFLKVDFTYVLELAKWAKNKGISEFYVISSNGADGQSLFFYLNTKGKMEMALINIGFKRLYIYRPPLLYANNRNEFRLGEVISYYPLKILSTLIPYIFKKYMPLNVQHLAKIIIYIANKENTGVSIIEPSELHQINSKL